MPTDDFAELIRSRRTVRDFLPDPIPQITLDKIFDDARECASWSNTRPYAIAVATGDQLERISKRYQKAFDRSLPIQHKKLSAILKAPFNGSLPDSDFKPWKPYPADLKPRSQAVGKGLYNHMGVARGDRSGRDAAARGNVRFFGAPTVIWVFVHSSLLPFSAMDAGLMLQTLMLSAKAHGVDSCGLGTLAIWRHPVDEEFQIPKDYKLITGLALGYASGAPVNEFRAEHPPLNILPSKVG